ncbi:MAG: sigma-70 family RNA polymerase sigma factor [Vicinamibacterales bacterium]
MASSPSEIYVAHHDLIERSIASVCRRQCLRDADAEDFAGIVRLHLIDNDYAVLRRFEGRSSLSSYLAVVITRQFQDWRNARWGKWRSSAEARRLGDVAVRLETLTVRDGLSMDEAHEVLRTHHDARETRAELEALFARFPVRHKRRLVDDDAMETMAATIGAADAHVVATEARDAASRAAAALTAAITGLPPQDRLILKMRFESGYAVADIAKALHLEAKPLYRRIERMLLTLRGTLEHAGLTRESVATVLNDYGFDALESASTTADIRLFPGARAGHPQPGGQHD